MIPTEDLHLLNEKQVCEKVGLGRVSIWKAVREKRFPSPVNNGFRAKRWKSTDLSLIHI